MKRNLLTGIVFAAMTFSACNDETLDIGNSLTQTSDKLTISNADYKVSTKTILADSILLRSSYCYLGRVKDPETGAYVKSELMTQFNVLESFTLPSENKIVSKYNDMAGADSCRLEFYMEDPTAITDTLAAMKIRVTELDRPMEENRKYYSNFDPMAEGLLRTDGLQQDKMFTYKDQTVSDTTRNASGYYHFINVLLNKPYTDKQGVTYNNYGTYVMQQYYRHPEYFKNSYAFIHNVCPGVFVSVTDGEGVYTEIPDMCLRIYCRYNYSKDSISNYGIIFAGTEEVLQTTKITNDKSILQSLVEDNTCTYIKSPAGLFTEVTLPIDEIFNGHENDSIMTAKISFQRINTGFYDNALQAPEDIMMIPKDSLYTFFENKKAPDNKTTFYTSLLNSSGVNTSNQYTFSNISSLVSSMATRKRMGLKSDSNWLATHPNWNKVLLVPVQIMVGSSTSTLTSTTSNFEHDFEISSTKLVGGSENPHDPIKLSIVYGKFNQ